jgi:hypothetical protein
MHCITRRSGLDADPRVNSECDDSSLLDDLEGETIRYQGPALATVAACGPWQARLLNIWDGVSEHGLEAWDLLETIVDIEDEGVVDSGRCCCCDECFCSRPHYSARNDASAEAGAKK